MSKPILFSTAMVQAILAGRKTQTRRVVTTGTVGRMMAGNQKLWPYLADGSPVKCPYGMPGDLLYVRETWNAQNLNGQWWHQVPKAERWDHNWAIIDKATPEPYLPTPPRWIPAIFMPKQFSRITLRIKAVRVEQVQSIGRADAEAEGCQPFHEDNGYFDATVAFCELWDSINAKRGAGYSWDDNPWVWVVEFKAVSNA